MISETFYNGFEKEMTDLFKGSQVVGDEDYIFMYGLVRGAHLCGHMNIDDVTDIKYGFGRVTSLEGRKLQNYIKVVKDLMMKLHED